MTSRHPYQKIEYPLPVATFQAGSNASVDTSGIPAQLGGRITHVVGFKFVGTATPTLSSGSLTPEELQRFVRSIQIKDGTQRIYFQGSMASLRLTDALERGFLNVAEPDAILTNEQGEFIREFNFAPAGMKCPEDFVQPGAIFRNGGVMFGWGALSDVDANLTALTASIRVFAILTLNDEVKLGALVERVESPVNNGNPINGEGLITDLALCNSASLDAIAAGDFANVQVQVEGFQRDAIHVADLEKMYSGDKNIPSGLSVIHGEPRTVTDDNQKVVAGTALAAAPSNISPVIWTADGVKISKLVYASKGSIILKWSGSQAAGYYLMTRIIPRTAADVGKAEALLRVALPIALGPLTVRTESKRELSPMSPRRAFLPLAAKVM